MRVAAPVVKHFPPFWQGDCRNGPGKARHASLMPVIWRHTFEPLIVTSLERRRAASVALGFCAIRRAVAVATIP
ncbi:MAG: hypothetical protein FD153_569 [Rhodospirillaceae bacterium]|nr:MAG: hypothetical protein FD153_569 [Rhodospirillaceae bacterium]